MAHAAQTKTRVGVFAPEQFSKKVVFDRRSDTTAAASMRRRRIRVHARPARSAATRDAHANGEAGADWLAPESGADWPKESHTAPSRPWVAIKRRLLRRADSGPCGLFVFFFFIFIANVSRGRLTADRYSCQHAHRNPTPPF